MMTRKANQAPAHFKTVSWLCELQMYSGTFTFYINSSRKACGVSGWVEDSTHILIQHDANLLKAGLKRNKSCARIIPA